jgi:hypothetical protein
MRLAIPLAVLSLVTSGLCFAEEGMQAPPPPPTEAPEVQPGAEPKVPQWVVRYWQDGDPVPPGYHPERRLRLGLLIAGAGVFVMAYGLSVVSALGSGNGANAIPVVGPLLRFEREPALALSSAAQVVGVGLLIGGVVGRWVLVRDEQRSVEVQPLILPDGAGVGLAGRF